jgi:hypothetical protein
VVGTVLLVVFHRMGHLGKRAEMAVAG